MGGDGFRRAPAYLTAARRRGCGRLVQRIEQIVSGCNLSSTHRSEKPGIILLPLRLSNFVEMGWFARSAGHQPVAVEMPQQTEVAVHPLRLQKGIAYWLSQAGQEVAHDTPAWIGAMRQDVGSQERKTVRGGLQLDLAGVERQVQVV